MPNPKLHIVQDRLLIMALAIHYAGKHMQWFFCIDPISTMQWESVLILSLLCRHNQSLLGTRLLITSPCALQLTEYDANHEPSLRSQSSEFTTYFSGTIPDLWWIRPTDQYCNMLLFNDTRPNFTKYWGQLPTIVIKGSASCRMTPESTVCHFVAKKVVWDQSVSCFN